MPVVRCRPPSAARVPVLLALVVSALLLGACTTLTSSGRVSADASAAWAVPSIENLSTTPLAGRQVSALIETRLRARGVQRVARVEPEPRLDLVALLDDRARSAETREAARRGGARYALGGTVHEWRYREAPERDPVVALSLRLEDLDTGTVMWQGSASRSGWGGASLSAVADRLVRDLLDELSLEVMAGSASP